MSANTLPRLVLGSSSPRRLDLLKQIGITPAVVCAADINEDPHKNELPQPYVVRLALEKNAVVAAQFPNDFIVTADTTVAVGRRIIGKPENKADAEKMIRLLSGRAHCVHTGVAVRAPDGKVVSRISSSRLKAKRLSDVEIAAYLQSDEWHGVAGAYRIQGLFAQYFLTIQGSPSGIIGLPLYETMQLLKGLGYHGH